MSGNDKIAQKLAELEGLDHAGLKARWKTLIGRPPPKAASRVFLLRAMCYELQAKYAPGLAKADERILAKALSHRQFEKEILDIEKDIPSPQTPKPSSIERRIALVPGSRLVREWNGQSHTVSVIEEGFVYKDRIWSSLSAIAKDITGAHWSGPRFFGLYKPPKQKRT